MWHKEGYEYYAYLPKDRGAALNYHLFSCLGETRIVKDNGRFHLDDMCTKIWSSLEKNLTHSIQCVKNMGLLISIEDVEPPLAEHYGYLRSHPALGGLSYCLRKCRHVFLFHWAYFLYMYSFRHERATVHIPPWAEDVSKHIHYAWVDSLWDAIHQQTVNKNFVGTVVHQHVLLVRWVEYASCLGVPIWVSWHSGPDNYKNKCLDGYHVLQVWCPTKEQVLATIAPPPPATSLIEGVNSSPLLASSANTPALTTPSALALPPGSRLIPSWQDFFQDRDEANKKTEATAAPTQKQQWESHRHAAQKHSIPGH